jgi:hypothetical protein
MTSKLLAQINFDNLRSQVFPDPLSFLGNKDLTLGGIISKILPYIFVIAGLILFVFLIMGGFELLTSAGNPESAKKAQGKITSALVGFIIIFLAYWLAQALGIIFGIQIF